MIIDFWRNVPEIAFWMFLGFVVAAAIYYFVLFHGGLRDYERGQDELQAKVDEAIALTVSTRARQHRSERTR